MSGILPYPGCSGCAGGLTPFDALTSTSSHELCELCEAITDPIPGQGWRSIGVVEQSGPVCVKLFLYRRAGRQRTPPVHGVGICRPTRIGGERC